MGHRVCAQPALATAIRGSVPGEGSRVSRQAWCRTYEDLFHALYCGQGFDVDLSGIRIHYAGVDAICRAWGACALTVGSDICFRSGFCAPHTVAGLWLLAHEVAHVVQQRRGPVAAVPVGGRWALGSPNCAEEREASAAADAVLAGQRFEFGPASPGRACLDTGSARRLAPRVVQRYMAWEHLLLGNLDPAAIGAAGPNTRLAEVEAQCALIEALAGEPADVDEGLVRARFPGAETVRLPGSGLVVTLGELNVLPDYLSHPADIIAAPAAFIVPVVQGIRAQSYRQLNRITGRRQRARREWSTLRYPYARAFSDIREAVEIDALGRKCQRPSWERYLSVLTRNAAHFAPFSWYRWQAFHLQARQLIAQASMVSGDERRRLRSGARVYAGYADHFLHDSFAAGHLVNKTLIMQWYVEWLLESGSFLKDQALLASMTYERQPFLHGPDLYDPVPQEDGQKLCPDGGTRARAVTDPQSAAEAATIEARVESSGVSGSTMDQRLHYYRCYLALLGSSVAQLSSSVVHDYLNSRSLVVASGPDGPRYRIWGDRRMLAGSAGALRAAAAAHTSRRAITDLLTRGETDIATRRIFESMPSHVEVNGDLLPLRQWHDAELRDLCFGKLFGLMSTRVRKLVLGLAAPRMGVPSADYAELPARRRIRNAPG
jgi:hypothetical protein